MTNALHTSVQQVTHYVYDNQGNITSMFYPDGSGLTNKYDSLRRVTNVINGFASMTNYFNNQGLLITSSNAFGQMLSTTYDILDHATNSVDANGVTTTNTYDNLNRLLTRGYPDGGVEKFVVNVNGSVPAIRQLRIAVCSEGERIASPT